MRTLVGSLEVRRIRMRCEEYGEESYPLDEELGLKDGAGTTLGVRERALWAAVVVSYEKAHQFLKKYTGLEVSRKKIYAMAIEEGGRIAAWEERRGRRFFKKGGRFKAGRSRKFCIFRWMGQR